MISYENPSVANNMTNVPTELYLYRAKLASNGKKNVDLCTMRILPEMIGVPLAELPKYPALDKTQVFHGVSEEDVSDPNFATDYYVLATSDFQVGYVLCEAGLQSDISKEEYAPSHSHSSLFTYVKRLGLNTNRFNSDHLRFYINTQSDVVQAKIGRGEGGKGDPNKKLQLAGVNSGKYECAWHVDCLNIMTGDRYIFLSSGTSLCLNQEQITMRVGSPDTDFSKIEITNDHVKIETNNFICQPRKSLSLGAHGGYIPIMYGNNPVSVDGMAFVEFDDTRA